MYKFDPAGEPLSATLRAIALSQFDEMLADLDGNVSTEDAIHQGRRRSKKLRGLLRLVRPAFPDFSRENAALRDVAAMLSHLRDADVLRHTIAELAEHAGDDTQRLRMIADRLTPSQTEATRQRLGEFRAAILAIRARATAWSLTAEDPACLFAGLRDAYRSARRTMRKAARSRVAIQLHEWRKATKIHGFHIDLLKRTAPDLLEDDLKTVEALATCLGLHHDLAVLNETIALTPERFGDAGDIAAIRTALALRLPQIEQEAFALGRQIFAEGSKAIGRRFRAYWDNAQ